MEFITFTYESKGHAGIVTLSRPESLNALNIEFFSDLNKLLDQLEQSENPPILIITGEGKAFAAGADIAQMVDMNTAQSRKFSEKGQQTFSRLEEYPMPVIAAINGYALGGGCELALACDIRIAADTARIGMPEASLGLIPGFGGTQRLPRMVGPGNALFLLLTSESVTAQQALQMGLVQQVCPSADLLKLTGELAGKIASMGPKAIKNIKRVVRKGSTLPYLDGYELETNSFSALFEHEGQTGMRAFLNKVKPQWDIGNK